MREKYEAIIALTDPVCRQNLSEEYRELARKMTAALSRSTVSQKAKKTVRDKLDIKVMDPEWSLPSNLNRNPMAWMIQVNGFIVDARRMPRHVGIAQDDWLFPGLIPL